MKFYTEVIVKEAANKISHKDGIMLNGSCFTENIGNKFVCGGFETSINPFGILYNPVSICESLNRICTLEYMQEEDLVNVDGFWKSCSHHGSFRSENKEELLMMTNDGIRKSHDFLANAGVVILTLGTAWIYTLKESNRVLGNCHKLNSNLIRRSLLTVEQVKENLCKTLDMVRSLNPKIRFIITISPIRHWKEGYRDNMLSKSTLHLGVEAFCTCTASDYFPSYEIVMDQLRDYRFYAEDMLHPNQTTVNYIWDVFSETYISRESLALASDFQRLFDMKQHRAFNPESEGYRNHLRKTETFEKELYERREKMHA